MAGVTVDNGALSDFVVDTVALSNSRHIQRNEIVTAVEAGTATALAKLLGTALGSDYGIPSMVVRKDTPAALSGVADGDLTFPSVDATGRTHVAVPVAQRTTDSLAVALQTDAIMSGLTALTPKFFSESVAASDTDEELVALVSAKIIRVVALVAQCAGTATDMTFESSTTTRIHKIPAGANGGQVLPPNPWGWFQTASGASLTVTTGTGSTCEISGAYIEV